MENTDFSKDMKRGAITFIDVLGWKGIWQRKENALNTLKGISYNAKYAIESIQNINDAQDSLAVYKNLSTEIIVISDTIAIATYSDECELSLQYQALLCSILIADSIRGGIPFRGATCYGDFIVDDTILVGPAIDEVASWHEIADWIGVIHTPSALFNISSDKKIKYCSEYNVPLKGKGKFKTNCIDWPTIWKKTKGFNEEDLKSSFLKMGPITPDIAPKFTNTMEFYRHILAL